MSSSHTKRPHPLASPRPPPPDNVFTSAQWNTLMAMSDALIPSIHSIAESNPMTQLVPSESEYSLIEQSFREISKPAKASDLEEFLLEHPSENPDFRDLLSYLFGIYVPADVRQSIATVLDLLTTRMGSLIFVGSLKPFEQHTVKERDQILQSWAVSYLPPLQKTYEGLGKVIRAAWLRTSPTLGRILGFPRVPMHGKAGKGFDYKFMEFSSGNDPVTVETDVVVVGSSCGGSVVAKNLAEGGHQVIVVDKGYHFLPEHLPMTEFDASTHLFESGGLMGSDDGSISMIAGSGWGGGGSINWSASLQTQGYVRKEWADEGLKFFESNEYQRCLDRVCDRMGVSTKYIKHNPANVALLEGARKLGWAAHEVPQNTGGNEHYCGYCTLGCGSVEKQGPIVSFLPDAVKAGAQMVEGLEIQKILFEDRQGVKTAVGVQGIWTGRDDKAGTSGLNRVRKHVTIKAKKVVSSAGTLWSPILLLNSGLKNPQIGANFHCHPVSLVYGVSHEEIRPWEGSILTSVCTEFSNIDGHGHGCKIEATTMLPSWSLAAIPWDNGVEFKKNCLKFKHMTGYIALARDRDSGRIYPDPKSRKPRVAYSPSTFDRQSIMEGMIAIAKILYVTGAEEIHCAITGVPPFVRPTKCESMDDEEDGINTPEFQEWLVLLRKTGLKDPATAFASAHQMGSCRMGISERTSVVNSYGKVWGTESLYVSDASIFPSASGVNPMVTNMAISDHISRHLSREMTKEAAARI